MAMHPSRQAYVEEGTDDGGLTLANVPTEANYTLPSTGGQQTSHILHDFRRKREAAAIAVPTDDKRVRADLRSRGEPITLFGERPEDRRDRLRQHLYADQTGAGADGDGDEAMGDASPAANHQKLDDDDNEEEEEQTEFYTEGTPALLSARQTIAKFSLPRAAQRIQHQRLESTIPVTTHVRHRKAIKSQLSTFELVGSQIASERPVSIVRMAPDNERVVCGDWAGSIKILDVPNLETQRVLRGHKGMIGGLAWFPGSTLPGSGVSEESLNLASGGGEGDVHLWSLAQETPIATLAGHASRVCRTEFHPGGAYLASASYDTTWRLWDLETSSELLLQEGHSKEVYTLSFSPDGSLLASAGLDSIGRIWDLRTGRTVMLLESHVAPIFGLDWAVDGVRCMTGSSDGFAKCWDLRAVRETASIGAHRGGVADLRWFKGADGPLSANPQPPLQQQGQGDVEMANGGSTLTTESQSDPPTLQPKTAGTFLVSAGFDKAVNIFSADDWALCASLTGHDGTVLSCDVGSDARWVVSCGRDRTVKVWGREEGGGDLGMGMGRGE